MLIGKCLRTALFKAEYNWVSEMPSAAIET
jgi:hypothetical protein